MRLKFSKQLTMSVKAGGKGLRRKLEKMSNAIRYPW